MKYLVILRYRKFLARLFNPPEYIFCKEWEQVETVISENGETKYAKIECLGDIRV